MRCFDCEVLECSFLFRIKIKIIIIILSHHHHPISDSSHPINTICCGLEQTWIPVSLSRFHMNMQINSLNGSGEGHKNGMLEDSESQTSSQMMTIKPHFIISYTYILLSSPCLPLLFLLDRDSEKYVIFLFIIFLVFIINHKEQNVIVILFLFWFY